MSTMPLKYVRFIDGNFALFSNKIQHATVALPVNKEIKSAGFVMIEDSLMFAYGNSTTLDIKSDSSDTKFFKEVFSMLESSNVGTMLESSNVGVFSKNIFFLLKENAIAIINFEQNPKIVVANKNIKIQYQSEVEK